MSPVHRCSVALQDAAAQAAVSAHAEGTLQEVFSALQRVPAAPEHGDRFVGSTLAAPNTHVPYSHITYSQACQAVTAARQADCAPCNASAVFARCVWYASLHAASVVQQPACWRQK